MVQQAADAPGNIFPNSLKQWFIFVMIKALGKQLKQYLTPTGIKKYGHIVFFITGN